MNIFALGMMKEVFGRLRRRFQIPIREADEGERCYSGNAEDIGFDILMILVLILVLFLMRCKLMENFQISLFTLHCWIHYAKTKILMRR